MNVQLSMHNRGINSHSLLLLNVSPYRNKICWFWVQEFSQMHTFQVASYDFQQESSFLVLLVVGKGQGLFFISVKGQGAFSTSKKRQGAFLTSKKGQGKFLTSKNFFWKTGWWFSLSPLYVNSYLWFLCEFLIKFVNR